MRLLKESLLSLFVVGVVLSLYVLAAAAALFTARGLLPDKRLREPSAILKSGGVNLRDLTHTMGELQ